MNTETNEAPSVEPPEASEQTTRLERAIMSIEQLEQSELSAQDLAHLKTSSNLWKQMAGGKHFRDWLALLPDLQNGRRLAMRYANVNKPEGRGYAEGFSAFLARWFKGLDKTSISCLLWLGDDPERMSLLNEMLSTMTTNQLVKFTSPITARKKIEARLRARGVMEEPVKKVTTLDRLHENLRDRDDEIAELKRQLEGGDAGSLFDLKKDKLPVIARIIFETCGTDRTVDLIAALNRHMGKAHERKKQKILAG